MMCPGLFNLTDSGQMCLWECSELSKNIETFISETILQFEIHLMREIDLGRLELLNELSDVDKSD